MKQEERKFSIGRARGCDIVLADDSVSRYHAELTLLKGGKLLLTDCKSSNGSYLLQGGQEKEIRQELVSPTDTVQLGDIKISVKELLEAIMLKFPGFQTSTASGTAPAGESPPQPKKNWVKGKRLVRCECGAVKTKEELCPECGK